MLALVDRLSYAGNEAARRYIDGEIDAKGAAAGSSATRSIAAARAQRVRFIDQYRSYVINYNLGKDMVKRYVESKGGPPANATTRWECSSSCCRRRVCRRGWLVVSVVLRSVGFSRTTR